MTDTLTHWWKSLVARAREAGEWPDTEAAHELVRRLALGFSAELRDACETVEGKIARLQARGARPGEIATAYKHALLARHRGSAESLTAMCWTALSRIVTCRGLLGARLEIAAALEEGSTLGWDKVDAAIGAPRRDAVEAKSAPYVTLSPISPEQLAEARSGRELVEARGLAAAWSERPAWPRRQELLRAAHERAEAEVPLGLGLESRLRTAELDALVELLDGERPGWRERAGSIRAAQRRRAPATLTLAEIEPPPRRTVGIFRTDELEEMRFRLKAAGWKPATKEGKLALWTRPDLPHERPVDERGGPARPL